MAASPGILVLLALGVLVLPVQWIFAMVLAACFHEWCHRTAIRLCGGRVGKICFGLRGAKMNAFGLSVGQELFCALAGPLGGILLMLLARWMPRTALCAAFQSLFNLLPVYPLDGGRALRCLGLELIWLEKLTLLGIVCLGLYGSFVLKLGVLPLVVALVVLIRAKRPCKQSVFSVQ